MLLVGPHHGEPAPIPRVLACVDGSKLSEAIVPAARRWARAAGTLLWLIHAVEPNPSLEVSGPTATMFSGSQRAPTAMGLTSSSACFMEITPVDQSRITRICSPAR